MELCTMLDVSLDGRGVYGRMDTGICMAESHHCSPETTTTLSIDYTPIQNKSLKLKIRIHFLLYFSLNISNTQIEVCFIFILFIFPEIFYVYQNMFILGLPCWLSGKDFACQCGRYRFDPWVRKISWRRKWQPTPVFLSRKSHEQRSLAVCSPWGRRKVGHDWVTKQQQQWCLYSVFYKNGPIT